MTLTGENLDAEAALQVAIGNARANVEVSDSTRGKFSMPDGLGMGLKVASVVGSAGEVGTLRLIADSAGNSLPIIVADASQVCSDIIYINAAGEQATGTRDCSGSAEGTVDPFDIRKGKTVSGVAGKLNARCQNTSNLTTFNMAAVAVTASVSTVRAARVRKITDSGILTLGAISGVPLPPLNNTVYVRPLGNTHPIKNGDGSRHTGRLRFSTQIAAIDGSGNPVYTDVNVAGNEIALYREGTSTTETFTSVACDETLTTPVSTDCFDLVVVDDSANVWDTIDDDNFGTGASPRVPSDLGAQEAFNTGVCGYLEAPDITVPAHANATWRDVTRTNGGAPSSCAVTPANCSIMDLHSGLTWFKGPGVPQTWFGAVLYCSQLTKGGLGGWRLPTQKELMSAYINSISRINSTGTVADYNMQWWSATTQSQDTNQAWWVNLSTGQSGVQVKRLSPTASRAMCVRGP
ncbi:MAG: hypothetical protein RIQ81_1329 [Pseudomonadota bacterium]